MMTKKRKGAAEVIEVLMAVLTIVIIFALVVMMNMRFRSVIDTYMPFRMAVLVANRLSSSPDLTITPAAGESAHKNLLSAKKLDGYVAAYKNDMPPSSAMPCFHWRAVVKEPSTNGYGYWEFGHNTIDDLPSQMYSAIMGGVATTFKSLIDNPINVFKFAFPTGTITEASLKEMVDMAPAVYALPVSVVTEAGADSCASAGGTCRLWTGYYCGGGETDVGIKDCPTVLGVTQHCCVKNEFLHIGSIGATTPAVLEVTVWKVKSECRSPAIINKILEEVKRLATG